MIPTDNINHKDEIITLNWRIKYQYASCLIIDVKEILTLWYPFQLFAFNKMSTATKIFLILSVLGIFMDVTEGCGPNGMCTIISGCNDKQYCYRRHCTPKGDRLSSCIYGFQQNTCLSGLSCKCNSKLCDAAAITSELGNGLGGLGIPDLGSAISSCCRCA